MRLDSKVHGTLIRNKDGREIPEDEFVAFRPGDNAFLPALDYYKQILIQMKAEPAQLNAVYRLISRVQLWRELHPERCKVPDVQPDELQE